MLKPLFNFDKLSFPGYLNEIYGIRSQYAKRIKRLNKPKMTRLLIMRRKCLILTYDCMAQLLFTFYFFQEELQLALFNSSHGENLFLDRVDSSDNFSLTTNKIFNMFSTQV